MNPGAAQRFASDWRWQGSVPERLSIEGLAKRPQVIVVSERSEEVIHLVQAIPLVALGRTPMMSFETHPLRPHALANPLDRMPPAVRKYAEGEWEELVRKSPLSKLERMALERFFHKPKGSLAYVKGAGPATIDRLKARGFIAVLKERDEGRFPYHEITPAGEAEWLRIKS